jgi:hypothetical protein
MGEGGEGMSAANDLAVNPGGPQGPERYRPVMRHTPKNLLKNIDKRYKNMV